MKKDSKVILYVDDDEDDRIFLTEAFRTVDPQVDLVLAENGMKALDYLAALDKGTSRLPCLIILDLNMPYLDGMQTCARIRKDPALEKIPMVIFTSSESPTDKASFNSLGIEFITKPSTLTYMNRVASHMLEVCA